MNPNFFPDPCTPIPDSCATEIAAGTANRCIREQGKAKCVCGSTNGLCMEITKPFCGDNCKKTPDPDEEDTAAAAICVVIDISFV